MYIKIPDSSSIHVFLFKISYKIMSDKMIPDDLQYKCKHDEAIIDKQVRSGKVRSDKTTNSIARQDMI